MDITHFFDRPTGTLTYVIHDPNTKHCAIIDPVLNYQAESASFTTQQADQIIEYIHQHNLKPQWILETHIHADHLTAAHYLKAELGCKLGIGAKIRDLFDFWNEFFSFEANAKPFDHLFENQESFKLGEEEITVIHTPGHTPSCSCYCLSDAIFVGDTVFKPQSGTARADFPGGSAKQLFESIHKILSLPPETKLYLCHDYPKENQPPTLFATVKQQKSENIMVNDEIDLAQYVSLRTARDATLSVPKLILPALQFNLMGGQAPFSDGPNKQYLKLPLNAL